MTRTHAAVDEPKVSLPFKSIEMVGFGVYMAVYVIFQIGVHLAEKLVLTGGGVIARVLVAEGDEFKHAIKVAASAATRDKGLSADSGHRGVSEIFAPENIGNMDLDHGDMAVGHRVGYSIGIMGICSRINYYSDAVRVVVELLNEVNDFPLAIGPGKLQSDAGRQLLFDFIERGLERRRAIGPGVSDSEPVKVGAVDYGHETVFHIK